MSESDFSEIVASAAKGMIRVEPDGDFHRVVLPGLYPSGSNVSVMTRFDGANCFVSDYGQAQLEAELLGASSRLFSSQGKIVAEQTGCQFDDQSFFVIKADISRISGAIKVVASASLKAAMLTEARVSEQAEKNDRDDLVDRLVSVFGAAQVDKDFELNGASTHTWNFAGRVISGSRTLLFDCTGPSHNAVYSTHAKFSDIARIGSGAPGRVAAISRRYTLKTDYRNLLQQTANVIHIEEQDETYSRFAA